MAILSAGSVDCLDVTRWRGVDGACSKTLKEFKLKKIIMLAAVAAFAAPQAFAQAKNFQGFSLTASAASTRTSTEDTTIATGVVSASDSGRSTGLDLQAQYAWALGKQFVLGVGVTLGSGNLSGGRLGTTDVTTKERASLDLIPGYAVSDSLLLYGKLSAITGTAEFSGIGSKSGSGLGYGLGLRALVSKNWFFQGGYDLNVYDKVNATATDSVKINSSVFSLGGGYQF